MDDRRFPRTAHLPSFLPAYAFSRFCLRHRAATLVAAAAVTLLLGWCASQIEIDASTKSFVLRNDPDQARYRQYLERFGSDSMLAIGVDCLGSCFDEAELRRALAITERLEHLPEVKRVASLATVPYVTPDGRLAHLEDLLAEDRVEPPAREHFDAEMRKNRIVAENLISADGKTSVFYVYFEDDLDEEAVVSSGVLDRIRKVIEAEVEPGRGAHVVGNPLLRESLRRIIRSDLFIFVGATQLLVAFAVFVIFRSLRIVATVMVFVWVTLAWTFGLFAIAGQKLNLVTAILSPLLITVCVTIATHLFVHNNEERLGGCSPREAVFNTICRMGRPCFLTSLTTAIGLGSLAVNRIPPVRNFGLFGALGTMLSFVLAFALLPIALAAFRYPVLERPGRERRHPVLQILGRFSRVCVTHPWPTLVVAGVVAVLAVAGIVQLRIETRIISYFKSTEPIVRAYTSFDRKGLGITGLQVMVSPDAGDVFAPEVQEQIARFADAMRAQPHVAAVTSSADCLLERDRLLAELKARGRISWANLLRRFGEASRQLRSFVSADRSAARINIRLTNVTSTVLARTVRAINAAKEDAFDPSLDVVVTGGTKLYLNIASTLLDGQIRSIALAFVAITIVMAVVFRSIKIGVISMVPNILPILITLGVMGWVGITLNGATVMIASVAIGIVVDATIHFLHRYRREYLAVGDFEIAIRSTLLTIGQPISYAGLILFVGFTVLVFGNFRPTNYFGAMTAFTMLSALVITLLILPVCLNLFHLRFGKNSRTGQGGGE